MNPERIKSTTEAIDIAKKYLKYFKVDYYTKKYVSEHKTLSVYKIISTVEEEVISAGKGRGGQALASGLFEAIEHYAYFTFLGKSDLKNMKISDALGTHERLRESYPLRYLLKNYADKYFQAVAFQSFENSSKKIFIPSFLLSPREKIVDEELEKLTKYNSNNGCAVGVTKEEALIHSINEIIERDSVSKHLINYFLKNSEKVSFVDRKTLPRNLFELLVDIESTIGNQVYIVDVTYLSGFYTYYVWVNLPDRPLPIKGAGTSLSAEYALERALSEVFQAYMLYDEEDYTQDMVTKISFAEKKTLSNLISCVYQQNDVEKKAFPNDYDVNINNLDELLSLMISKLKMYNLNIFYNIIFEKEDISCVKTVIPGTENFQLINSGVYTLPNNY